MVENGLNWLDLQPHVSTRMISIKLGGCAHLEVKSYESEDKSF